MYIRIGRIVIAALAAEIFAIVVLFAIVAALGPDDQAGAQSYAREMGYWVGPIAGFVFCLLGGWWVARSANSAHVLNGFLLGLLVAVIDITILIVSGAEFEWVFVFSNLGRIIAGSIGGWIAGRAFAVAE